MARANGEEVQLLPWPSEWKEPGGTKPTVGVLTFGAFGVAAGIAGLTRIATGIFDDSTLILLAGSLLAMSLTCATALMQLRVRQRGTSSIHTAQTPGRCEPSTIIPNLRGIWLTMLTLLASMLIVFGLVATVSWGFLATGAETGAWMTFQALLSTAFVAGILWFFWKARQGLFAQGALTLAPSGITYKAWGPERHIPWEIPRFRLPLAR